MYKTLLILTLFLFAGCFSNESLPKWYIDLPKKEGYLFAVGEGYSRRAAVDSALSDLASKLTVNVRSSFFMYKSYQNINDDTFNSQEISKKIKTEIKKTDIFNYEIVKQKKENDKFYVLIKIDKVKNGYFLCQKANYELDNLNTNIKDKIEFLKSYSFYINKIDDLIYKIYIADILAGGCESSLKKAYLKKNMLEKEYESIGFDVDDSFLEEIFSSLSLPVKKNSVKVFVNKKFIRKKINGRYISVVDLNIRFKDLTTLRFNFRCASSALSGFESSDMAAMDICKKEVVERLKKYFKIRF